jgi:hypothetical protein
MTYSLPGQDVLSKYINGLENIFELAGAIYVSEPGAIESWAVYVSDDLSYAETYLRWPNQAAWLEWQAVYGEDWREMMEICDRHAAEQGITVTRTEPEYDGYDWNIEGVKSTLWFNSNITEVVVDPTIPEKFFKVNDTVA